MTERDCEGRIFLLNPGFKNIRPYSRSYRILLFCGRRNTGAQPRSVTQLFPVQYPRVIRWAKLRVVFPPLQQVHQYQQFILRTYPISVLFTNQQVRGLALQQFVVMPSVFLPNFPRASQGQLGKPAYRTSGLRCPRY